MLLYHFAWITATDFLLSCQAFNQNKEIHFILVLAYLTLPPRLLEKFLRFY